MRAADFPHLAHHLSCGTRRDELEVRALGCAHSVRNDHYLFSGLFVIDVGEWTSNT
jgi:hypothetical protein